MPLFKPRPHTCRERGKWQGDVKLKSVIMYSNAYQIKLSSPQEVRATADWLVKCLLHTHVSRLGGVHLRERILGYAPQEIENC